jgi:hypothetical protein
MFPPKSILVTFYYTVKNPKSQAELRYWMASFPP